MRSIRAFSVSERGCSCMITPLKVDLITWYIYKLRQVACLWLDINICAMELKHPSLEWYDEMTYQDWRLAGDTAWFSFPSNPSMLTWRSPCLFSPLKSVSLNCLLTQILLSDQISPSEIPEKIEIILQALMSLSLTSMSWKYFNEPLMSSQSRAIVTLQQQRPPVVRAW